MANTTGGEGGSLTPASADLSLALGELAESIKRVGSDRGRCWTATVRDTSIWATTGLVYATLGESEVVVICPSTSLSVGQGIIVSRYDNSQNSPYVLHEHAGAAGEDQGAVPYDVCFPAPMSSPLAEFDAHWGGTILSITPHGGPTFALTVGGVAVGVGDAVAPGALVTVTATAGADSLSSVKVVIG